MRFLVFVLLLAAVGGGAWFTRPTLDAHRARVAMLMDMQHRQPPGEADKLEGFRDAYVATQYRLESGGQLVMECFGAFTQFVCLEPETPRVESF